MRISVPRAGAGAIITLLAGSLPAGAATAFFNTGTLAVAGDDTSETITVSADADGNLQVTDNGVLVAIHVAAGIANKSDLTLVMVDAAGGDDIVALDASLNMLSARGRLVGAPNAVLVGGFGNDRLTSAIGGVVRGILGKRVVGNVVMEGGDGNDVLVSGHGNDQLLGGNGNDTLQWHPGAGLTDTWDGGSGFDDAVVVGNDDDQGDDFTVSADPDVPGGVLVQRTNLVPFLIQLGQIELISVRTQSGNDHVTVASLAGVDSLTVVSIDAGDGDDVVDASGQANGAIRLVVSGGDGQDSITGGAGDDTVDGGGTDGDTDMLAGGLGADTFVRYATEADVFLDFNAGQGDVFQNVP